MFRVDDGMKHGCIGIFNLLICTCQPEFPASRWASDARWNSEGTGSFQRTMASEARLEGEGEESEPAQMQPKGWGGRCELTIQLNNYR